MDLAISVILCKLHWQNVIISLPLPLVFVPVNLYDFLCKVSLQYIIFENSSVMTMIQKNNWKTKQKQK